MDRPLFLIRRVVLLVPFVLASAACDANNPTTRSLSVSTTTQTSTSTGTAVTTAGGSLTLSAAQVVLRKIKLSPVGTTCATETEHDDAARLSADAHEADDEAQGDADDDSTCEVVQLGPTTVNLPLDATIQVILDALVPAGTYTGVKAQLDAVKVSGVFTDAAGATHPFDFTSTGHAEVEIRFPAPVTVGPTTSNVTITVDVASWFKDASGAVLDPSDVTNLGAINRNIRQSFRAFGDDDHDGVDDDHEGAHDQGEHD
jgi:hypothetical protein